MPSSILATVMRALLCGILPTGAMLGTAACDPPRPSAGADAGAASPAPSGPPATAFGTGDDPPHAQLRTQPDAGPLDAKSIAEHWRSATRVRYWWVDSAASGDAGATRSGLRQRVLDDRERERVLAAVGKEVPVIASACPPCPEVSNLVAEDATGLQLGTLELGCHADERLRFHGAASDACATLDGAALVPLRALAAEVAARTTDGPGIQPAKVAGPSVMP